MNDKALFAAQRIVVHLRLTPEWPPVDYFGYFLESKGGTTTCGAVIDALEVLIAHLHNFRDMS